MDLGLSIIYPHLHPYWWLGHIGCKPANHSNHPSTPTSDWSILDPGPSSHSKHPSIPADDWSTLDTDLPITVTTLSPTSVIGPKGCRPTNFLSWISAVWNCHFCKPKTIRHDQLHRGFSGGSDSKESVCKSGDLGSTPGRGRSPGEGNGYPLQYSFLENSMDTEAWWVIVHGVAKSWTWLSG